MQFTSLRGFKALPDHTILIANIRPAASMAVSTDFAAELRRDVETALADIGFEREAGARRQRYARNGVLRDRGYAVLWSLTIDTRHSPEPALMLTGRGPNGERGGCAWLKPGDVSRFLDALDIISERAAAPALAMAM